MSEVTRDGVIALLKMWSWGEITPPESTLGAERYLRFSYFGDNPKHRDPAWFIFLYRDDAYLFRDGETSEMLSFQFLVDKLPKLGLI